MIARKVDKPLTLYGAGELGRLAMEVFLKLQIPTQAVYDISEKAWSRHPQFATLQEKQASLLAICIASEPYQPIYNSLVAAGWTDIVSVYDVFEAYPECGIGNGWFAAKFNFMNLVIFNDLYDEPSASHYLAFVNWHVDRDEYPLHVLIEPREHLPSTLRDIEQRQRVATYADAPMKNISIHAEGCELKTIKVNMHLFQKYRPTIDVSCYHSRDGLWKIEKALMDGLPDYRWTFRMHAYCGQAAFIYGCPKERV